jgi:uncharacterized repeat protein (TIGR03803 family)
MLLPVYASLAASIAALGLHPLAASPKSATGSSPHTAVLYSFRGGNDGANPYATMNVGPDGGFFGTTVNGGPDGDGTVFGLKLRGRGYVESVQYAFHGSDGAHPYGSIIQYGKRAGIGTCADGGAYGFGDVFEITPSASGGHAERVLYSFQGGSIDGANPFAGVIVDTSGDLFGTTLNGGANGAGTAFELKPARRGFSEKVLYNFNGRNGEFPYAPLIEDASGSLYGTTHAGGAAGLGTVFKLTPNGADYSQSVLYSFAGGQDGANPYAGLEFGPTGPLYGTTQYGGPSNDGTVFELKPSGSGYAEDLNFAFDRSNGYVPNAAIVRSSARSGAGTTAQGGQYGAGVVFELTPNGSGGHSETVLHAFTGGSDGAFPYGGLVVDATGSLYGATYQGGAYGFGTIYQVMP